MTDACKKILNFEYSDELDKLYHFGGTNGGARPKIMTEINGKSWIIKFPAYDLTYSTTYYGKHTTTVDGNGVNPSEKELFAVGMQAGLSKSKCMELMKQVHSKVSGMLGDYL